MNVSNQLTDRKVNRKVLAVSSLRHSHKIILSFVRFYFNRIVIVVFIRQIISEMALSTTIYNAIFKKTSTMALACVTCAFFFERTFDLITDNLFEKLNEGKLYKDIKTSE